MFVDAVAIKDSIIKFHCPVWCRNALLTVRHQEEILSLLTRCNMLYLDYLCSIFELCEVPVDQLVGLAKEILHSNHLKEAVTFIFTLGIQEHFKMEQVCGDIIVE